MFRSIVALRIALVLFAVLFAALIGLAIPTVALAAPPVQEPPTDSAALAQAVGAFIDLLLAAIIGGGLAYVLQMWKAWREWSSPLKPLIVLVLTALLGAGLSSLKVIATAELFDQAPEWGRAFIGFIVVFFGSQLTYQRGFAAPPTPSNTGAWKWNLPQ